MTMDHLIISDTVRGLLECAKTELVENDPQWNGRVCMNPYSTPTRDDCCNGQLQGTIERLYPSSAFPLEDLTQSPCGANYMVADVIISVTACLVGVGHRGQPLSCEKLDDAHDRTMIEAKAVWTGVSCCLLNTDIEWLFRGQVPLDNEQGGCMGSDLFITIGVPLGCLCDG